MADLPTPNRSQFSLTLGTKLVLKSSVILVVACLFLSWLFIQRQVRCYSSVDIVGHVNNSRYVEWICDAFPMAMYKEHKLDWMQINYEHEILPGEEVSILVNPIDHDPGLWALEGHNRTNGTRAFESLLHWRD